MNIVPYKDREIDFSKDVYVYRNLNIKTTVIFSIMQDGLVVAHGQNFFIRDAKAVIRKSGRVKFVETGKRNVHAFIRGRMVGDIPYNISRIGRLWYDREEGFKVNDQIYKKSDYVHFAGKSITVWDYQKPSPSIDTLLGIGST